MLFKSEVEVSRYPKRSFFLKDWYSAQPGGLLSMQNTVSFLLGSHSLVPLSLTHSFGAAWFFLKR